MEITKNFWKNKKVLITGHTGFKKVLGFQLYLITIRLNCMVSV